MNNLLTCKICGYQSKQLFQHLKHHHHISVSEYRDMFGKDEIVQLNFIPPSQKNVDSCKSMNVKKSYEKIKQSIEECQLYSFDDMRNLLITNDEWKKYVGKSCNRKMIRDNISLYKSILYYTSELETIFNSKENFNFVKRIKFIIDHNCDINKLKCECGKKYTWNTYCRYCPEPRKTFTNKKHTIETKLKMRLSALEKIEQCNGQLSPRYNKNSIKIIEEYGKLHGYNFKHAENGGEYYIKELGYWLDGYDPINNIAIEIDEKHHFNSNGSLKTRDIIRENEIINLLKCKFIRIKYE